MGAITNYITTADANNFQPMNANFGIMRLQEKTKKKERKEAHARVALACMDETKEKFVPWKTETSM